MRTPSGRAVRTYQLCISGLVGPVRSLKGLRSVTIELTKVAKGVGRKGLGGTVIVVTNSATMSKRGGANNGADLARMRVMSEKLNAMDTITHVLNTPMCLVSIKLRRGAGSVRNMLAGGIICKARHKGPTLSRSTMSATVSVKVSMTEALTIRNVRTIKLKGVNRHSLLSTLNMATTVVGGRLRRGSLGSKFSLRVSSIKGVRGSPVGMLSRMNSTRVTKLFNLIMRTTERGVTVMFSGTMANTTILTTVRMCPRMESCMFPSTTCGRPIRRVRVGGLKVGPFFCCSFAMTRKFNSTVKLSLFSTTLSVIGRVGAFKRNNISITRSNPNGKQRERSIR